MNMNTGGISGGSPNPPEEIPGLSASEALGSGDGSGKGDISGLLDAKISTLGELKSTLIKFLGEKDGMKFYNQFMTTFAVGMLQQIQQSAQQAKKAAQGMRMDT